MTKYRALGQPITEMLGTFIVVLLLWTGAKWVLVDHTLQASQFLVFLTFVMRLLQPLKQLSQIPTIAQQLLRRAERLFEVLDDAHREVSATGARAPSRASRAR